MVFFATRHILYDTLRIGIFRYTVLYFIRCGKLCYTVSNILYSLKYFAIQSTYYILNDTRYFTLRFVLHDSRYFAIQFIFYMIPDNSLYILFYSRGDTPLYGLYFTRYGILKTALITINITIINKILLAYFSLQKMRDDL